MLLRTVSKDSKNHWKKKYPYTEFSSDEIKSRLNHCDIITKRSDPWESVEDNILIWFFFRGKSKTFWIHPIQYVHLAVIDISPISTKMRLVFFFFFLFLVFSYSINYLTEDYKWSKLIFISPWKTFRSNCPDKFVTGQKYGSIDVKLISYFFFTYRIISPRQCCDWIQKHVCYSTNDKSTWTITLYHTYKSSLQEMVINLQ